MGQWNGVAGVVSPDFLPLMPWQWDVGYVGPVAVRRVTGRMRGLSVLYLSDFHWNAFSAPMAQQLAALVQAEKPDILLLGGDYVDTARGLAHLDFFLKTAVATCSVWAIAGNHDYFFGIKTIRQSMLMHGVQWLEKSSAAFVLRGITVQLDTRHSLRHERLADVQILCLHEPFDLLPDNPYDLALAGHLHGSQVVLWENERGLYPGRWFYRWNVRQAQVGDCLYVVSCGLGDTLPVRVNCGREGVWVGDNIT
jgi:uncharacterized protein